MSSGGTEYVYTRPVPRSTSKFDTGKKSHSWGQLNSILPLLILLGNLVLIKSLIRLLLKLGTYQSNPISPCLLMYSSMFPSLMPCWFPLIPVNSTVGFRAAFSWSMFGTMCPGSTMKLSPLLCASWLSSCHCVSSYVCWASVMALVWTPNLSSAILMLKQSVLCCNYFTIFTLTLYCKNYIEIQLYCTADLDVCAVLSGEILSNFS